MRSVFTEWGEGPFIVDVSIDDRKQGGIASERYLYDTVVKAPDGHKGRVPVGSSAVERPK